MSYKKSRRFDASRKRQRPLLRHLRKIIVFVALVFVIYGVFTTFLADSFVVDSVSMRPTYRPGDRLATSPLWYGPQIPFTSEHLPGIFSPRRGDLVVISPPYANPTAFPESLIQPFVSFFTGRQKTLSFDGRREWENNFVIRRIIALPGDTVRVRSGEAYVRSHGTPDFVSEFSLSLSAYEILPETLPEGWISNAPLGGQTGDIFLGEEEYFVLADNRAGTLDSRLWGPVHEDRIVTKVLFRYWPLGKRD
ncbi:MAG: signal peptidase I [Spirochaetales bacterium]|jgi:signal peptidase I|nr:signal peptidase I [Spirochaetales bacterium]